MNAIPKIAPILRIKQEKLERESLETYLHIRLKRCESELFNLARKYEVSSIEDFEEEHKRGNIGEKEHGRISSGWITSKRRENR